VPALFDKILRAGEGKILRKLKGIADQVNAIEEDFVRMSDAELRGMTDEFKRRLADEETLDDILPEAFAAGPAAGQRPPGPRA
jgi:preprotein translocase subunit SecA